MKKYRVKLSKEVKMEFNKYADKYGEEDPLALFYYVLQLPEEKERETLREVTGRISVPRNIYEELVYRSRRKKCSMNAIMERLLNIKRCSK